MELILHAWAKVNLTLSVQGRRPDGYHLLHSYAISVDLNDEVMLRADPSGGIALEVGGLADGVPTGSDNLAWKAAALLRERYAPRTDRELGVAIRLVKGIPAAAGVGGASADAAAVLHGLNRLWNLRLTDEELAAVGLELGADVPFCLLGGLAIMEGIGERLKPLPPPGPLRFVVVTPPVALLTGDVFRRLDAMARLASQSGRPNREFVASDWDDPWPTPRRPVDADVFLDAWRRGPEALAAVLYNDLERPAAAIAPDVYRVKEAMLSEGAVGAVMSGSGPTVLGLPGEDQDPEVLAERMRARGWDARVVGMRPAGVSIASVT